jgi:hypothetical protein
MITGLLALAAQWWKAAVGAAVMFPMAFMLGQCSGESNAKAKQKAADAVAIVEVLKTDAKAKEKAADERLADAEAVAETKEKLTDAVQNLPDAMPSARRVALACQRLRNDGQDVSRLPACSGPQGPGQAPAAP